MPTRFPPYPAYKPSNVPWLGNIPAHWEVKRLKYVAPFSYERLNEKPDDLPYIGLENIESKTGRLLLDAPIENVESTVNLFNAGDLLFGKLRPYLAKVALPDFRGVCTTEILALQPTSETNVRFLFYKLLSVGFINLIDSFTFGSKMPRASSEQIGNVKIGLPPLPEQRAIAAFLDRETARLDALIAKNEQLIERLQEKRTALISRAVTKGLDANARMKDSGVEWLGEVPEGWEVRRLKHTAEILRGKFTYRPRNDPRFYDGQYPFIQTGNVAAANKYITDYEQTLNEEGLAVSKMFPSGTLVMTIAANIGDVAILQFAACFPDSIVGIVPHHLADLNYLYWQLSSMSNEMKRTAVQNTQLNLNVERIGDISISIPPLHEQRAIAEYLDEQTARLDALATKIQDAIERLREYRGALIAAAVTGKVDVRDG